MNVLNVIKPGQTLMIHRLKSGELHASVTTSDPRHRTPTRTWRAETERELWQKLSKEAPRPSPLFHDPLLDW